MTRTLALLTPLRLMPLTALHATDAIQNKDAPNIVVILADDMRYSVNFH